MAETRVMPRIALIHALSHSVAPVNAGFVRRWPRARLMNLLDDSLSADLAASERGLDPDMYARFLALADYAVGTGAQAILFTCSAFGPCIDAVAQRYPAMPVLKPNTAMIDAVAADPEDGPVGLIASFAPTLVSMPPEFPVGVPLQLGFAEGALEALNRGDVADHDTRVVQTAIHLRNQGCSRIALSQFSMARARDACAAATGLPVYTTVDSAVEKLQRLLQ